MQQWLIKLLPTTSAKFVNLNVSSSITAQVSNLTVFLSLTWAVSLSDIPLVLSIYLLLLIANKLRDPGFVLLSSQGHWYVHSDGTVKNKTSNSHIKHVNLTTLPFKLSLTLESGEMVTIWRDSCDERCYRQLSLILRQWKMKQGAKAPC
ncbi:TPA: protein YgfX [Vibrio parahaemolyticus]|uniref:protein YgfX n=1 Tax=Vibrio parahaemolyticus TaxID=670 RepID=UPI002D1E3A8C|nr:protein YgfX [Vibrio parahaemolyticus]